VSDLTAAEHKNVRTAIRFLRVRCGGWVQFSKAIHLSRQTLQDPNPTPLVVFRVARFAGVGLDDVLAGRFPEPGTCPHCGHVTH
jgi:hypothetical protein